MWSRRVTAGDLESARTRRHIARLAAHGLDTHSLERPYVSAALLVAVAGVARLCASDVTVRPGGKQFSAEPAGNAIR